MINVKEAWQVAAAVLTSVGGGGVIVFGVSGFVGKRWADRALEKDRHEFSKLALEFKSQLDRLGLVHELRIKEEFDRLAGLWKQVATLRTWFNSLPHSGFGVVLADPAQEEQRQQKIRTQFSTALDNAGQYLGEEAIFIPKQIADSANELLRVGQLEELNIIGLHDLAQHSAEVHQQYFKERDGHIEAFNKGAGQLEMMMREHVRGERSKEIS